MDDGQATVYASGYTFHPEKIFFSETDEAKITSHYFTLEKIETYKTRLTVDFYLKKGPLREALFRVAKKKKMEAALQRSLIELDGLVKELKVPLEY